MGVTEMKLYHQLDANNSKDTKDGLISLAAFCLYSLLGVKALQSLL